MSMKFVLVISSEMQTILTLCPLGNFSCFLSSADFFKINFLEKILIGIPSVSNSLDPDQPSFVRPDLGLNCTVCKSYQQRKQEDK